MSYFDDNEDYLIYGKHHRRPRNFDEMAAMPAPNCWRMANGEIMRIKDATESHLVNMRAKLKRENRGLELQDEITAELMRRTRKPQDPKGGKP